MLAGLSALTFIWLGTGSLVIVPPLMVGSAGVVFVLGFALLGIGVGHGLPTPLAGKLTTAGLIAMTWTAAAAHGGVDSAVLVLATVAPLMALVLVSALAAAIVFLIQVSSYLVLLLGLTPGSDPHWIRALSLTAATGLAWVLADRLWRDSAGLYAELERRERLDPLTGVANRRRFFEALREEFVSPTRSESAKSVILIEIDAFSDLTERYGNRSAERCMIDVAQFLTDSMRRETDTVARLASGEFGVVLAATTPFNAQNLITRTMELLRDVSIPHEGSSHGVVTLSAGVAGVHPDAPDESPARAQQALAAARAAGGNQALSADSSTPLAFPRKRHDNTDHDVGK